MKEELYTCANCRELKNPQSDECSNCTDAVGGGKHKPSGWKPINDMVNHPQHYLTKTGLETIDVIEAFTEGMEGIEAVCTANVIKYICRWKKKNGIEDLKKAEWYLNRLIKKESK